VHFTAQVASQPLDFDLEQHEIVLGGERVAGAGELDLYRLHDGSRLRRRNRGLLKDLSDAACTAMNHSPEGDTRRA
jgi:hypothetical protein